MKKSLIALAVLAAAGVASAQSNVTLYGKLDLGAARKTDTTAAGVTTTTTSLAGEQNNMSASRVGLTGTEDLGGGLKAGFVYEFGINADNSATASAVKETRLANVSLAGGFGKVTIGTQNNALANVFWVSPIAGMYSYYLTNPKGYGNDLSKNALQYNSPSFSGFDFSVLAASEKMNTGVVATSTSGAQTMLGANYNAGALGVHLAHGTDKQVYLGTTDTKATTTGISASYDFGFAVPYAVYTTVKTTDNLTATNSNKVSGYEVGSSFPMGAFTPYISLGKIKGSTNGVAAGSESRYEVGTTYALSKRTSLYGLASGRKAKLADGTNDDSGKVIALGLIHSF